MEKKPVTRSLPSCPVTRPGNRPRTLSATPSLTWTDPSHNWGPLGVMDFFSQHPQQCLCDFKKSGAVFDKLQRIFFFPPFYITDLIVKALKFPRSDHISPLYTDRRVDLTEAWIAQETGWSFCQSTFDYLKINNPWVHQGISKKAFCKKRKENPSVKGILSKLVKCKDGDTVWQLL